MKCYIITKKNLMFAIVLFSALIITFVGSVGALAQGDKLLPIYCVETEKKQIAISFDAA